MNGTRHHVPAFVAAALLAGVTPGAAGQFGIELQGGYHDLAASKSAQALFGSSGGATFGGATRWAFGRGGRGLFVEAGARTFSKEGERVFVASPSAAVAKLGFPVSIRITPIFANVGYRFRIGKTAFTPYVGLGGSLTSFREESDVAGEALKESRSKAGFQGLGGVEYGRGLLRLGAEVVYSTVPDAVGLAGVSKVYGEDDIGGLSLLGKVVFTFGGRGPATRGPSRRAALRSPASSPGP